MLYAKSGTTLKFFGEYNIHAVAKVERPKTRSPARPDLEEIFTGTIVFEHLDPGDINKPPIRHLFIKFKVGGPAKRGRQH
jgi:hypothetical protein